MVKKGHFSEMSNIVDKIKITVEEKQLKMQSLVFSATLTFIRINTKSDEDARKETAQIVRVLLLHAKMIQRARLNNLEKFAIDRVGVAERELHPQSADQQERTILARCWPAGDGWRGRKGESVELSFVLLHRGLRRASHGRRAATPSSLDGTVRARDMKRYRNFRTLVCSDPTPLGALEVDASGEVECAAAVEMFQIFIWSMENGQLIDVLSGHTATIADISLRGNTLASVSWDKTLKLWESGRFLVGDDGSVCGGCVALSYSSTKDLIAILSLYSVNALVKGASTSQMGSIDCKHDLD